MVLTGQNNHGWEVLSAHYVEILEETGLFEVDLVVSPPHRADMSRFAPDFDAYDVVVLEYNGDRWPAAIEESFERYMLNGGGMVYGHAVNHTFKDWVAFNEMMGLGGWGGRDENAGPFVKYRDGTLVLDHSPGHPGECVDAHEYEVVTREADHPIMRDLPPVWLHGTGDHEPIAHTVRYGQGRVFGTAMGHVDSGAPVNSGPWPAIECVGFTTLIQRGAEWAATGQVTQPIPESFPTAQGVGLR